MNSDESKSEEQKPIEEESVLNKPKRKLILAADKRQKSKPVEPKKLENEAPPEPPKKENIDLVKEKAVEIFEKAKKELSVKLGNGIGLKQSAKLLRSNSKMIVISLAIVLIMLMISIFLYYQISSTVENLVSGFYNKPPELSGLFDYIYYAVWGITKLLFNAVTVSVSFFVAFILSYILCSPLNSMLSVMAEEIFLGKPLENDDFSAEDIVEDIKQSLQVSGLSLGLIILAFFINLIPVIGQIAAILIVVSVSSLLLNDFVTSRKNWNLKTKILWLKDDAFHTVKIGGLPAFLSMIPVLNNIILAFSFPLFVIFATLNFSEIEKQQAERKSHAQ